MAIMRRGATTHPSGYPHSDKIVKAAKLVARAAEGITREHVSIEMHTDPLSLTPAVVLVFRTSGVQVHMEDRVFDPYSPRYGGMDPDTAHALAEAAVRERDRELNRRKTYNPSPITEAATAHMLDAMKYSAGPLFETSMGLPTTKGDTIKFRRYGTEGATEGSVQAELQGRVDEWLKP